MVQDYTIPDLKRYMEDRLESKSSNALFEFSFQRNCRDEIESLPFSRDSGRGILFTFAAVAGGWKPEVGRRLVADSEGGLGVGDDFVEISETDLTTVGDAGYGGHPHRHANGAHPEKALYDLPSVEIKGTTINSMSGLFGELREYQRMTKENKDTEPEEQPTSFDLALDIFTDVNTFGQLSAFDFLELAVRVNCQSWLTPSRLKPAHVDRNGPGETMKRVVTREAGHSKGVRSEVSESLLEELSEFVRDELQLGQEAAFFDVESCLCTYHGELEDEGPDWRESCS